MSTRAIVLGLTLAFAIAGAASSQQGIEQIPAPGAEATASPGSAIYTRREGAKTSAYRTTSAYSVKVGLGGAPIIIPQGSKLIADARLGPGLCTADAVYQMGPFGLHQICVADQDGDGRPEQFRVAGQDRLYRLPRPIDVALIDEWLPGNAAFVQTLTYLGTANGALRLSYREFKNDMARPAFTEEISYETPKQFPSKVAFRNIVITILSVDNLGIRYQYEVRAP